MLLFWLLLLLLLRLRLVEVLVAAATAGFFRCELLDREGGLVLATDDAIGGGDRGGGIRSPAIVALGPSIPGVALGPSILLGSLTNSAGPRTTCCIASSPLSIPSRFSSSPDADSVSAFLPLSI